MRNKSSSRAVLSNSTPVKTGLQSNSFSAPPAYQPSQQVSNQSPVLFADTPYYSYSYQVFPGQLSQQAAAALTGFTLSNSTLSDGSENVTISLSGTSSASTVNLPSGYKLYIIEASYGDDGFNHDSFLGDDQFVEVNSTGYVIQTISLQP
jgi:hypothetical protein